ncbi:hypothetical protein [Subtercola sp. YIM 133946]|uniref:hypothetical protein n=1 Tax=Subtercola sp. YIM 133946 TaxID=3118909 RepID=UPI002F95A1E1
MTVPPALTHDAAATASAAQTAAAPADTTPTSPGLASSTPVEPATLTSAERAALRPVDRVALALGTALVAWSHRAERRVASDRRVQSAATAAATTASTATVAPATTALNEAAAAVAPAPDRDAGELHSIRRRALHDVAAIEARRGLGINQLLR